MTKIVTRIIFSLFIAYLVASSILFALTLSDAKQFIVFTKGSYCWVYSSVKIYTLYNIIELTVLAAITVSIYIYIRRAQEVMALFLSMAALVIVILVRYFQDCG